MTCRKKLIEVALPLEAINRNPRERSPFGTAVHPLFICGGRADRGGLVLLDQS
jgi:hypothetical protein